MFSLKIGGHRAVALLGPSLVPPSIAARWWKRVLKNQSNLVVRPNDSLSKLSTVKRIAPRHGGKLIPRGIIPPAYFCVTITRLDSTGMRSVSTDG